MNEIIWKKASRMRVNSTEWITNGFKYIYRKVDLGKKKYTKIMWVWVVNKIDNRSTEWMAILDCNMEFCAVSFGQTPINNIHACTHTYIFFLSLSSPAKSECINLSICQNGIVVGFFSVHSLIYSSPSLFLLRCLYKYISLDQFFFSWISFAHFNGLFWLACSSILLQFCMHFSVCPSLTLRLVCVFFVLHAIATYSC